jgi:hypothetical protein
MLNVISFHLHPLTSTGKTDVRSFIFHHPVVFLLFNFNNNELMVDKGERFIYSAKLEKTANETYPPAKNQVMTILMNIN